MLSRRRAAPLGFLDMPPRLAWVSTAQQTSADDSNATAAGGRNQGGGAGGNAAKTMRSAVVSPAS